MDINPSPSGRLASVIRRRYEAVGYNQTTFADATRIKYRTLRRRMDGAPIRPDELGRIAEVLNTTPSDLWREVEASQQQDAA